MKKETVLLAESFNSKIGDMPYLHNYRFEKAKIYTIAALLFATVTVCYIMLLSSVAAIIIATMILTFVTATITSTQLENVKNTERLESKLLRHRVFTDFLSQATRATAVEWMMRNNLYMLELISMDPYITPEKAMLEKQSTALFNRVTTQLNMLTETGNSISWEEEMIELSPSKQSWVKPNHSHTITVERTDDETIKMSVKANI